LRRLAAAALAALVAGAQAHGPAPPPPPEFDPPAPGSYALPAIQAAPAGTVLGVDARARDLRQLTHGKLTLLGLVYTRCADPDGCPRATWAFSAVRSFLRERPHLESRVRLVTLSFDPAHDTPARLGAYARRMGALRKGAEWHFVTTASRTALDPILKGFGQDLRVAVGSKAKPGSEEFTHTLKVFLLDARGQVREIYATAYLVPEMLVNDLETLARE
jgi:protein SCO1